MLPQEAFYSGRGLTVAGRNKYGQRAKGTIWLTTIIKMEANVKSDAL